MRKRRKSGAKQEPTACIETCPEDRSNRPIIIELTEVNGEIVGIEEWG